VDTRTGRQLRIDIDITLDFKRDTPNDRDPDRYNKTLRRYHKLLWSRRLPSGEFFELDDNTPGSYLHHRSAMGEFSLSSDAVIPTFKWAAHIKELIADEELKAFNAVGYTIGGMMVWPGNPINGKWTINQARGCTKRIGDRFDLTLECIRRHYSEGESPLSGVLARYARFFDLFGDFRGYTEFFFLQDLVSTAFSAVTFSLPFDNFTGSPIPADAHEYNAYKSASIAFIEARNRRILASARRSSTSAR
jgi:hypothetical protein